MRGWAHSAPEPAGSVPTVNLRAAKAALLAEGSRPGGEHRARTLVQDDDIRVVLVALASGARLAELHAGAVPAGWHMRLLCRG